MGVAWYVVPEQKVDGLEHGVDGKALAHAPEAMLEALFAKLKVKPLMEFFSMNLEEQAYFLGEEGAHLFMPEEWHEASAGVKTVRALLEHLHAHPDALPRSADVIRDLEQFETVLEGLEKAKVRWHVAIDV